MGNNHNNLVEILIPV